MSYTSFFSGKKISQSILVFLMCFFLISGGFTFADAQENPPTGKLRYGSYTNWLDSALENSSGSSGVALGGENNVVKQANSLSIKKGEKVLWIQSPSSGKIGIGIGIQTPQEIFDIRSEKKATLLVESTTDNSQFLLGDQGIVSLLKSTFFLQVGSQKIFIIESGINAEGEVTVKNKNIVLGEQQCPAGEKISGTDDEGVVICIKYITTVPYCNINDIQLSAPIRVLSRCQLPSLGVIDNKQCVLNLSGNQLVEDNCILLE